MAPRVRWTAPLQPGALAGSVLVHGGLALVLVGWWVLPERAARGTQAPIRVEPSAAAEEVVAEQPARELERLPEPEASVESALTETRPEQVEAEPLFPEEPFEPLREPRWEAPWGDAPPDLMIAARPRGADQDAEPALDPEGGPLEEADAEPVESALESPALEASPRGLDADSEAPVEEPGACEPPLYPPALASRGLTARVRLAITVGVDGRVKGVEILESFGHRPLVERAAQAVWTWRYTPGRRDGEVVEWVVEKTIVFDPGGAR